MSAAPTDGIPRTWSAQALSALRGVSGWRLAKYARILPRIEAIGAELKREQDRDLRKRSLSLRYRAKSGEPLRRLLPEAYALVREAAARTKNMRHYDVQILGGLALFHGAIAEMQTGEGKTLTATLPMYVYALPGKGAHLATVNDYLAERDAGLMGPVYEMLGMSVGVVKSESTRPERRTAYGCDITYGTAKEFGFDFLRDRLLLRRIREQASDVLGLALGGGSGGSEAPVARDPYFCLVDEADSVLIDEARTPLIIGVIGEDAEKRAATFRWAADAASDFHLDEEYLYDHEKRSVELTYAGRQKVRTRLKPPELNSVGLVDLYEHIERAIKVERDYLRDREYVVRDKDGEQEIVIVDESTGRLAEGRKWRDGIHQAIEAKERIKVTAPTGHAARVTVQDFFLRYPTLAGMTGTAANSAGELRKIYKLKVVVVPTNRPCLRERLPDKVFSGSEHKWRAVIEDIRTRHAAGQPVLVGTRSIEKSEVLSRLLQAEGIAHDVLNAHQVAREAEIVAQAGQPGRVTVATNMAGRGTDIKLGEGVDALGGLYVICTELHDSARIDRQLVGRSARQGDPGLYRQYMALDDDVLRNAWGPKKAEKIGRQFAGRNGGLDGQAGLLRRAQRRVERDHLRQRTILLYHEKQRKKLHLEMGQDPYLDAPE